MGCVDDFMVGESFLLGSKIAEFEPLIEVAHVGVEYIDDSLCGE